MKIVEILQPIFFPEIDGTSSPFLVSSIDLRDCEKNLASESSSEIFALLESFFLELSNFLYCVRLS